MRIEKLTTFLLGAFVSGLLIYFWNENRVSEIRVERQALKRQLESLNLEKEALRKNLTQSEEALDSLRARLDETRRSTQGQQLAEAEVANSTPGDLAKGATGLPAAKASAEFNDFRISAALSRVERLVALSEEQKERLKNKYKAEQVDPAASTESVKDILGPETYASYKQAELGFRNQVAQEMLEQEVYTLTRKLALSAGQEKQVQEILTKGRAQFRFPVDLEDDEGRSKLNFRERGRIFLQLEAQRQQYNAEQLRAVLNDTQYNEYLAMQATSAANRSHQGFLESEEKNKKPTQNAP